MAPVEALGDAPARSVIVFVSVAGIVPPKNEVQRSPMNVFVSMPTIPAGEFVINNVPADPSSNGPGRGGCIPLSVAGVVVSCHAERSEASTHVRRFFAALRMTSHGHFRPSKRDAPARGAARPRSLQRATVRAMLRLSDRVPEVTRNGTAQ